jgi:hypothetical protein
VLIRCRVLDIETNCQRTGLLRVLLYVARVFEHFNVIGNGRGRLQSNVIANLANGWRKVSFTLTGNYELKNLAAHWCQDFSHVNSSKDEQLFAG